MSADYYGDRVAHEDGAIPSDAERAVVISGAIVDTVEYNDREKLRQNAKAETADGSGSWVFYKGAQIPLDVAARQWDDHEDQLALYDAANERVDEGGSSTQRTNAKQTDSEEPRQMSETQSGTNDAQTDDQISTWGDIDDAYRNLTPPEDVSAEDSLVESEVNEWISGIYDRVDQRDLDTWQALPEDEQSLELLGLYEDRGSGPGGEQAGRSNARMGQTSDFLVNDDEVARRQERIESGEIEVPVAGDPFAEGNGKQADRGPMRTDGPMRVNADAGEKRPDVAVGGDPFGTPQSKGETRNNSRVDAPSPEPESRESKLERVNAAAGAVYEKLEVDGPETVDGLASQKRGLSRHDVGRMVHQLQTVDLVERVGNSDPHEFAPAHETRQNARSDKFDEL